MKERLDGWIIETPNQCGEAIVVIKEALVCEPGMICIRLRKGGDPTTGLACNLKISLL